MSLLADLSAALARMMTSRSEPVRPGPRPAWIPWAVLALCLLVVPASAGSWGSLSDIAYKVKSGDGPRLYNAKTLPGDIVKGNEVPNTVCFTFDDGPDYRTTPVLLDQLDRYDVKAGFFINGWKIHNGTVGGEENRAVLRQIAIRGHYIGNHTFSHKNLTTLPTQGWNSELHQVEGQVAATIGHLPRLFRPPFGAMGPAEYLRVTRAGYRVVMWTIDTLDWQAKNAAQIVKRFAKGLAENPGGGIVVMHDTNRSSVEAFPLIMEWLEENNRLRMASHQPTLEVVGLERYLAATR